MELISKRVTFKVPHQVHIESAAHFGKGVLMNLSLGGIFVATSMDLPRKAQVTLNLPSSEEYFSLELEAEVSWKNNRVDQNSFPAEGYGFRFLKLNEEAINSLQHLIKSAVTEMHSPISDLTSISMPSKVNSSSNPPYPLRGANLASRVPEAARGVFMLSHDREQVARVGRSDHNLRATLLNFVDQYRYFGFEIIHPLEVRFARECQLFHRLGEKRYLDNSWHPAPPPTTALFCPVCAMSEKDHRQGA